MLPSLSPILAGFVLGVVHAADPDHIAAVSTFVSRHRSALQASRTGALWGLGHTLALLAVGGAVISFRLAIPPRVGLTLELLVALMLIALGVLTLSGRSQRAPESRVRPIAVGVVHGVAGSGAAAVAALTLLPDPRWALVSLCLFGVGTIAGMAAVTIAIALPSGLAQRRLTGAGGYVRIAAGAASLALGIFLVHQVGIVDGLFTADPRWQPR